MTPEEWADDGLKALYADLADCKPPLSLDTVSIFIRAAYGRGYSDALSEPEEPVLLEALRRRDELALRIPVS